MKLQLAVLISAPLIFGCETIRSVENPFATAFSGFDRDSDGVISRQEAQDSPALSDNFEVIDTDRNGVVGGDEYDAVNLHLAEVDFSGVDSNGDGVISEREADAMRVSLKEVFDDVDVDGDRNVSRREYEAARISLLDGVQLSELDTDGDGVIGQTEAGRLPPLLEAFDRVDSDADGIISERELEAAM